LNFAIAYDLIVANTFFRKKKSHLITFNSGQHSNQIDFVLTRREERPNCMDCKVISGEYVVTKGTFLKCLRIELLRKDHRTKVRMRIICRRR
jgi:hypothetical protein